MPTLSERIQDTVNGPTGVRDRSLYDSIQKAIDETRKADLEEYNKLPLHERMQLQLDQKAREENTENWGWASRAGIRGVLQTGSMLGGLTGMAASAAEGLGVPEEYTNPVEEWGYGTYQSLERKASLYPGTEFSSDLLTSPTQAGKWVVEKLIENAPYLAMSWGTGAVGRAIGSRIAEGALGGWLERQTGKKLIEGQLERLGSNTGIIASTAGLEGGGMWGETLQKTGVDNPLSAMALGTVSGFVELAGGSTRVFNRIFGDQTNLYTKAVARMKEALWKGKPISVNDAKIVKRFATGLIQTGREEALEEGIQELNNLANIAINDPTFEKFTWENGLRIAESMVAGGATGGLMGATAAPFNRYGIIQEKIENLSQKELVPTIQQQAQLLAEEPDNKDQQQIVNRLLSRQLGETSPGYQDLLRMYRKEKDPEKKKLLGLQIEVSIQAELDRIKNLGQEKPEEKPPQETPPQTQPEETAAEPEKKYTILKEKPQDDQGTPIDQAFVDEFLRDQGTPPEVMRGATPEEWEAQRSQREFDWRKEERAARSGRMRSAIGRVEDAQTQPYREEVQAAIEASQAQSPEVMDAARQRAEYRRQRIAELRENRKLPSIYLTSGGKPFLTEKATTARARELAARGIRTRPVPVEGGFGLQRIEPEVTPSDREDQAGVGGEVGRGEEPGRTVSQPGGGGQTVAAGGVVQAQEGEEVEPETPVSAVTEETASTPAATESQPESRKSWYASLNEKQSASLDKVLDFMRKRVRILRSSPSAPPPGKRKGVDLAEAFQINVNATIMDMFDLLIRQGASPGEARQQIVDLVRQMILDHNRTSKADALVPQSLGLKFIDQTYQDILRASQETPATPAPSATEKSTKPTPPVPTVTPAEPVPPPPPPEPVDTQADMDKVLAALGDEAKLIDALVLELGMPINRVSSALGLLDLMDKVERLPGMKFRRKPDAAGTGTTPPAPAGETPPSESTTPTGETPGEPTPAEGEITPAKPTAGAVWIVKGPANGIDTVYEELPDNQILVRIVNKDDHTKEIGRKTISRPSTNDKTEFRKVIEQAGKDLYAPIIRQKEIEEEEKSLGEGEWSAEENNKKGYETQGWKLHLNVDRETAEAIHEFLMREGVHHKIGRSGGQEGKAMTIYAGSRDLANALAETINQKFGGRIQAPKGNVLDDDRQIVGNIWGRFDIGRKNNKYHQYGHGGVPILNADAKHIETQRMSDRLLKEEKTPEEYRAMWKEAAQKAEKLLEKEYGVYFTGTKKPPETTPTMTTTPGEPTPPSESILTRLAKAHAAEKGKTERTRLADIRKHFPDMTDEQWQAELSRLHKEGKILLYVLDDPQEIKAADQAAAVEIAGLPHHLLMQVTPEGEMSSETAPMETPAKEPWQIPLEEFLFKNDLKVEMSESGTKKNRRKIWIVKIPGGKFVFDVTPDRNPIEYTHRHLINKALYEGKPVPPEVLKDYPDLVKAGQGTAASLESRIFEAYMAETGGKDRQQVRLADFRKRFPDTPREELDAELKRMKSEGKILLIPQDDPLQIKDADREAAINIAGRDNHLIIIEGEKTGKPAPVAPAAETPASGELIDIEIKIANDMKMQGTGAGRRNWRALVNEISHALRTLGVEYENPLRVSVTKQQYEQLKKKFQNRKNITIQTAEDSQQEEANSNAYNKFMRRYYDGELDDDNKFREALAPLSPGYLKKLEKKLSSGLKSDQHKAALVREYIKNKTSKTAETSKPATAPAAETPAQPEPTNWVEEHNARLAAPVPEGVLPEEMHPDHHLRGIMENMAKTLRGVWETSSDAGMSDPDAIPKELTFKTADAGTVVYEKNYKFFVADIMVSMGYDVTEQRDENGIHIIEFTLNPIWLEGRTWMHVAPVREGVKRDPSAWGKPKFEIPKVKSKAEKKSTPKAEEKPLTVDDLKAMGREAAEARLQAMPAFQVLGYAKDWKIPLGASKKKEQVIKEILQHVFDALAQLSRIRGYEEELIGPNQVHPDWAKSMESSTGGRIVWSKGNLALLEGYSILGGDVLYSFVLRTPENRVLRSMMDVSSFANTEKQLTDNELKTLLTAREKVVQLEKDLQAQKPEGPFAQGNIVGSRSVPQALVDVAREWLKLLGLQDARIFLYDPKDIQGDGFRDYGLYGDYASARSTNINFERNAGETRIFGPDGKDAYIALNTAKDEATLVEILGHEIGHRIQRILLDNESREVKTAIIREYNQWAKDIGDRTVREVIESRSPLALAQMILGGNASQADKPLRQQAEAIYLSHFNEFFADNVSKWLSRTAEPQSIVEKFFKKAADLLKKLYAAVTGNQYAPNAEVKKWLDKIVAKNRAVAEEAVGYQVRRAAAPTKDLASDPDYVYHATNAERAMDIAQGKLRTHKPWENTDQDAWPDGSVEKRAYFSENAAVVWHFAPEFGEPVVLRIKKSAAELKKESITGDIYTKKTIDARHIEILGEDGEWYPVKQFYAEPGNVGGGEAVAESETSKIKEKSLTKNVKEQAKKDIADRTERLKPLNAIKRTPSSAYAGSMGTTASPYATDGLLIIDTRKVVAGKKESTEQRIATLRERTKDKQGGPSKKDPVSADQILRVWNTYKDEGSVALRSLGWIVGEDERVLYLDKGTTFVMVSADQVRLIQEYTGFDEIRQSGTKKTSPLGFFKNGERVALLMPYKEYAYTTENAIDLQVARERAGLPEPEEVETHAPEEAEEGISPKKPWQMTFEEYQKADWDRVFQNEMERLKIRTKNAIVSVQKSIADEKRQAVKKPRRISSLEKHLKMLEDKSDALNKGDYSKWEDDLKIATHAALSKNHELEVRDAQRQGHEIPPEVMQEYPELTEGAVSGKADVPPLHESAILARIAPEKRQRLIDEVQRHWRELQSARQITIQTKWSFPDDMQFPERLAVVKGIIQELESGKEAGGAPGPRFSTKPGSPTARAMPFSKARNLRGVQFFSEEEGLAEGPAQEIDTSNFFDPTNLEHVLRIWDDLQETIGFGDIAESPEAFTEHMQRLSQDPRGDTWEHVDGEVIFEAARKAGFSGVMGDRRGKAFYAVFNGSALLSRKPGRGLGSKVETVRNYVKSLARLFNVPIDVVQSVSDLPAHLQRQFRRQSKRGDILRGVYDPESGGVYLVADGIDDRREALTVVLHEVVGHAGLRKVLGEDYDKFLRRMAEGKYGDEIKALMRERGYKDITQAADEWFAEQVEAGTIQPTLWNRFVHFIKQALRKLGFNIEFGKSELVELVRRSREAVTWRNPAGETKAAEPTFDFPAIRTSIRGQHASASLFDKFMSEKIGTGEGHQTFGWGIYVTDLDEVADYYLQTIPRMKNEEEFGFDLWLDNEKIAEEDYSILEEPELNNTLYDYYHENIDINELRNQVGIFTEKKISEYDELTWQREELGIRKRDPHYEALKEYADMARSLLNAIDKNSLTIKPKPDFKRVLYDVTMFKGKQPGDYDLLRWDQPVPEGQREKIAQLMDRYDEYGYLAEVLRDTNLSGEEIYREIEAREGSRGASLALDEVEINGIQYPTGTFSHEKGGGWNYVIFNPLNITIENRAMYSTKPQPGEAKAEHERSWSESITEGLDILRDWVREMREHKDWKTMRPETTWLERIAATPAYYFGKVPALQRVMKAALEMFDNVEHFKNVLFNADGGKGESHINRISQFRKAFKKEYQRWAGYIVDRDRNAVGYTVRRDGDRFQVHNPAGEAVKSYAKWEDAWAFAFQQEAADMAKLDKPFSEAAQQALIAYRTMAFNEYMMLSEPLRRIVEKAQAEGRPVPTVAYPVYGTDKDGKTRKRMMEVDLRVALDMMGERIGYYMPRLRRQGRYQLIAEKDGIRELQYFKTRAGLEREAAKLRKEGYKIQKGRARQLPGEVYGELGPTMAMENVINQALRDMRRGGDKTRLEDFGLKGEWRKTTDGKDEFVVTGQFDSRYVEAFKTLKGHGFYEGAWHFVEPGENFEGTIVKRLGEFTTTFNLELAFAQELVQQVADVLRSHGSLAHRIKRSSATGEEVWRGYSEEPFEAIVTAGRNIAAGHAKGIMARKMHDAIMGRDISWQQFVEQAGPDSTYEDYLEMVNERRIDPATQPNAYKDGVDYMKDMLRPSESLDRTIGMIKGAAMFKYIAGRVSAPVINLTALPTVVVASLRGHAHIPFAKAVRLLTKAIRDYTTYSFHPEKLDAETRELFQEIRDRGWDMAQYNEEALEALRSKTAQRYDKFIDTLMLGFSVSERLNRAATIAAAYRGIKDQHEGEWTPEAREAALEQAKFASDRAHSIYGKANYPMLMRGGGAFGETAKSFYMFKNFAHNFLQNFIELGFKKREAAAAAWLIMSPVAVGGATAALPVSLLLAALRQVMDDDPEEALMEFLQENVGDSAEMAARFGVFGLAGVNLKGSLQVGITDIPTKVTDLLGAPYEVWVDLTGGIGDMIRGDITKGAEKVSPLFLGNMLKALREYNEGLTTKSNAPIFFGNEQARADTTDAVLRFLSFNPSRLARIHEKQFNERLTEAEFTESRQDIYAKFKKYFLMPEEKRTKAAYIDLLSEVSEYNNRVQGVGRADIPRITGESIRNALRQAARAPRKERIRAGGTLYGATAVGRPSFAPQATKAPRAPQAPARPLAAAMPQRRLRDFMETA